MRTRTLLAGLLALLMLALVGAVPATAAPRQPVTIRGPLPTGATARIDVVEKVEGALNVREFPGRDRRDTTDRGYAQVTTKIAASHRATLRSPGIMVKVRVCNRPAVDGRLPPLCNWEWLSVVHGKALALDAGRMLVQPVAWELDWGLAAYDVQFFPSVQQKGEDGVWRTVVAEKPLRVVKNLATADWRNLDNV